MQTIIKEEALFGIWCRMLASNILESKMLDEDSIVNTIKVTILDNQNLFLDCILDRLDSDILKLKKRAQILHSSKKGAEYIEVGYKLSQLNSRKKLLNIQKKELEKEQGSKRKKMWDYISNNHVEIFNQFLSETEL